MGGIVSQELQPDERQEALIIAANLFGDSVGRAAFSDQCEMEGDIRIRYSYPKQRKPLPDTLDHILVCLTVP